MRNVTELERQAAVAHPSKFLELALRYAPTQLAINFPTNEEATHFLIRLAASNKGKKFRPRNIWCNRDKLFVYVRAPKP